MEKERLEKILARFDELEQKSLDPVVLANQPELGKILKEKNELAEQARLIRVYFSTQKKLAESEELLTSDDSDLKAMAETEIAELKKDLAQIETDLKLALLPTNPNDSKNVIVEIRPAAGGDEAELFAAELYRLYSKYAANQNWRVEVMDSQSGSLGGLKNMTFGISGNKLRNKLSTRMSPSWERLDR